jgi:signal transduction histidine kinase
MRVGGGSSVIVRGSNVTQTAVASQYIGLWGRANRQVLAQLAWTLAGGLTLVVALNRDAYVAIWFPAVSTAISAVAATVGLTLFQLGVLHFRSVGRLLDLLVGIGFGILGIANVVCGFISATSDVPVSNVRAGSLIMLFAQAVATAFIGLAVIQPRRVVPIGERARVALWLSTCASIFIVGVALFLVVNDRAPLDELAPRALASLENGLPERQLVNDEALWILATNALLVLLLVLISYRLNALARETTDPYMQILSIGMILLACSQAHTVLFPRGIPGYISTADAFRLLAYAALLIGLTNQTTRNLLERASNLERMRLSRELHDGLAQQLMTVKLRLSQALDDAAGSSERSRRNLEISYRLVQDALLEARQSITGLRTGRITWQMFVDTVEGFCAESAENHGIQVQLSTAGHIRGLSASLQLEVLRILNETISNAVRHGEASVVHVEITIPAHRTELVLHVRDDGRGFRHDRRIGAGVGLQSLHERLEARGGHLSIVAQATGGISMHAHLPIVDQDERS